VIADGYGVFLGEGDKNVLQLGSFDGCGIL